MYLNPHSGDIPFMTSLWMGTRGVIYSIWGAVCARLSLLCSVCVTLCSWLWKAGGNRHITHAEEADETYRESQPMLYCTASESFVLPLVDSSSSSSSWSRAFATGSVHPQRFVYVGGPHLWAWMVVDYISQTLLFTVLSLFNFCLH